MKNSLDWSRVPCTAESKTAVEERGGDELLKK
jgi:hypothetical protein